MGDTASEQPENTENNTAIDKEAANPEPKSIFVFSVSIGGKPRVHEVNDTDEGRLMLANLIRTEQVLSVIIGKACSFHTESVVSICLDKNTTLVDRMPIENERNVYG